MVSIKSQKEFDQRMYRLSKKVEAEGRRQPGCPRVRINNHFAFTIEYQAKSGKWYPFVEPEYQMPNRAAQEKLIKEMIEKRLWMY